MTTLASATAAPATPREKVIDVGDLPEHGFGPDATSWWGAVLLVCIEGTMFVLLAATYLYVRGNFAVWPPIAYGTIAFKWATAGLALLLVSIVPMVIAKRAALEERLRPMVVGVVLSTVLSGGAIACRWFELTHLGFTWDANAHASVFWTTLGMHTFHEIAASLENVMFLVLVWKGPLERKLFVDVEVNAIYWYFMTAGLLPLYALLYLEPVVLR